MKDESLPSSLEDAQAAVAAALHWPNNLGIQLRPIRLGPFRLLAVYVEGLAGDELIRLHILEPLDRLRRQGPQNLSPTDLQEMLPAPRVWQVDHLPALVEGVLKGATALLVDGAGQAVLVETAAPASQPAGSAVSEYGNMDRFGSDLVQNVALVRKRLSDPDLLAEPHELPHQRGRAAVLYLKGRTDPAVLDGVREWVEQRVGEEAVRRGLAAGLAGKLGMLPERQSSAWPDQVAALLDVGYVAVLTDRVQLAYIAPVTAASMLSSTFDTALRRPVGHILRLVRLLLATLVLLASASVVALMNYHHEMIPAPFLLALASVRENAPMPILLEILLLEAFQELMREAGFHLPGRFQPGAALVGGKILILILVMGGVVGALQGAASVGVAFATLGLLSYELIYLLRFWRFAMIAAAGIFGFYGMATLFFLFTMYLAQAKSLGVPFFGEPGLRFTAPGRRASQQRGVNLRAP